MSQAGRKDIEIADLGWRCIAAFLDLVVPGLIGCGTWILLFGPTLEVTDFKPEPWQFIVSILLAVVLLGWTLVQWWAYGTRKAGFGYWVTGLHLVGLRDGKPIGWWRMFVRSLVYHALMVTVVGWIAMLIFLIIEDHRQGWHDMAVKSLTIQRRPDDVKRKRSYVVQGKTSQQSSVTALPPHLVAAAFEPQTFAPSRFGADGVIGGSPGAQGFASPPPTQTGVAAPITSVPLAGVPNVAAPNPVAPPAGGFGGSVSRHLAPSVGAYGRPGAGQLFPATGTYPETAPASQPSEPSLPSRGFDPGGDDFSGTALAPARGISSNSFGAQTGRRGTDGWYLRMDDGREVDLRAGCPVLVGRNPQPGANDHNAVLVKAGEGGQAVSKTHLMVGVDPRGVYLVDRNSTNGTALATQNNTGLQPCPAGVQTRVNEGQAVSFGDRFFLILRRPA